MKNSRSVIYTLALLICAIAVQAQSNPITGKVYAFKDTPIANIKITAKKSKVTATTDEMGNFSIEVGNKDKLVFEGDGFRKEVFKVEGGQELDVKMIFLEGEQNEKVAIGSGHLTEESLFYSKSKYLEYNNDFHTYPDIFTLLQGKFPGVKVYNELGQKRVVIRDIAYISGRDNTALYMVDGQIWQDISVLRPEEIISIDVMKDGAPLGFRAVNGVVLITTLVGAGKSQPKGTGN